MKRMLLLGPWFASLDLLHGYMLKDKHASTEQRPVPLLFCTKDPLQNLSQFFLEIVLYHRGKYSFLLIYFSIFEQIHEVNFSA